MIERGSGLCSHFRGVCTEGPRRPENRGALDHAVAITISETGAISRRVLQAYDLQNRSRFHFGD